jgi:hypothetical protein
MNKNRDLSAGMALVLAFGLTLAACGGKTAYAQSGSGGDPGAELKQAAGAAKEAAKSAVKDAAKEAVKSGGQSAAASDFVYELNAAGDGVIITGIQKDAKFGAHLVVPAEIEGFPVVAYLADYNDYAAKERKLPPLESVVFPDSVIYLGRSGILFEKEGGFLGDPDRVRSMEADYAELAQFKDYWRDNVLPSANFSQCKSLKSVVFPKNLKIIPEYFAQNCPLTTEGVIWPEAPEGIGSSAFYRNSFTELVIPEGVKVIGGSMGGAFNESKTLKSVTIPDSIEIISWDAFAGCPELTAVKIPAHPIKYPISSGSNRSGAFADCPKLGIAVQSAIIDTGYPEF